jgi:hypothetical protein
VTAGIDFGLTIASILYGEEIAKMTQLDKYQPTLDRFPTSKLDYFPICRQRGHKSP